MPLLFGVCVLLPWCVVGVWAHMWGSGYLSAILEGCHGSSSTSSAAIWTCSVTRKHFVFKLPGCHDKFIVLLLWGYGLRYLSIWWPCGLACPGEGIQSVFCCLNITLMFCSDLTSWCIVLMLDLWLIKTRYLKCLWVSHLQGCICLYQGLAREAIDNGDLLWKIRPKHHQFPGM